MRKFILTAILFLPILAFSQPNLALNATASASASSGGNYGPANWVDGVINANFFGWVGTNPATTSFPQPPFIQLEWNTPQTINQVRIFNVGTAFQPPAGNGVVFAGTADLQWYNSTTTQWVTIMQVNGQGSFGFSYDLNFNTVTTTKIRLSNFVTLSSNHNPGFDEIEVYYNPPQVRDLSFASLNTNIATNFINASLKVQNTGNVAFSNTSYNWKVVSAGNLELLAGTGTQVALNLNPGDSTNILFDVPLQTLVGNLVGARLIVYHTNAQDTINQNDTASATIIATNVATKHKNEIGFYPNPFSGESLFISGDLPIGTLFELFDLKGRLLFSQNVNNPQINLPENLKPAVYIVRVSVGESLLLQKKIVKQ